MPLFNQSALAASAAVVQIANTAGASAFADDRDRALVSLQAAVRHFNNKANWDFLRVEASPITVIAPFSFAVTASAGQSSAAVESGHGLQADDFVSGTPFLIGARISATAATSITLTYPISTAIGSGVQSFVALSTRDMYDVPSDWKHEYTGKLLVSQRPLYPMVRRIYDRTVTQEQTTGIPLYYDLYPIGAKGKVRLLQPPAAADVMQLRYYRRMTAASATAETTPLDIPQDYDPYLVAYAKWHFLMDKTEGRGEQAGTWLAFANDGLMVMLKDETRKPDESLSFVPGASRIGWGDNETRHLLESA